MEAPVGRPTDSRIEHDDTVVSLKGDSYKLRDRDLGRVPTDDQG